MEGYIVFSHELEELNITALPPFNIVFLNVIGCDRDVPNRSIKPNIKNLFGEIFKRN